MLQFVHCWAQAGERLCQLCPVRWISHARFSVNTIKMPQQLIQVTPANNAGVRVGVMAMAAIHRMFLGRFT